MSPFRLTAVVLLVAGVLVVLAGFYDFVTADEREGTPTGWYLLPVGGLLALAGLGMIGRGAQHGSSPFTDEEVDDLRREHRERGDD